MKTVLELRNNVDLKISELSSQVKYFLSQNIDWDVYLPTRKKNLQRDLVWTLEQKRSLIDSILVGRHIPHCAMINLIEETHPTKEKIQIIDGKQRLSSIKDFVENKFKIKLERKSFLFKELPEDYQRAILYFQFRFHNVNEEYEKPITDEQKIKWFKFINFAGTPQDEEHLKSLK